MLTPEEIKECDKVIRRYEKKAMAYLQRERREDFAPHIDIRSMWTRFCDALTDLRGRAYNMVRKTIEARRKGDRLG